MAKLFLLAVIAGALVDGIVARSEPPLLIDASSRSAALDAHG